MQDLYWQRIWTQFKRHRIGSIALIVLALFALVGIYAPLFACSKPLLVQYRGEWYFPWLRYLFYSGFFTKRLDIFYNLLMFTLPVALFWRWRWACVLQMIGFVVLASGVLKDPSFDAKLVQERQQWLKQKKAEPIEWGDELRFQSGYARLNGVLRHRQRKDEDARLQRYAGPYAEGEALQWKRDYVRQRRNELARDGKTGDPKQLLKEATALLAGVDLVKRFPLPTLYQVELENDLASDLALTMERREWLEEEQEHLSVILTPLFRDFHWEEDAGGEQDLNRYLPWYELTRINRKDLMSGLIFGIRISLVVGLLAMGIALVIGIPIGSVAGYYGGKVDIAICRLIEVWESMPVFFMLLMVVAVTQSKSIFLVIGVIGLFGWTGFSRFVRGECLKQRNLPYVEACTAMGFPDRRVIFGHILPNAIPPLLTLLPFSVMGAITSEAGLSFIGLGEEGSCSWGVLMDEGRVAFPGESYLLWPPAFLLTMLLVSIALVGDALRDAMDPKLRSS